MSSPSLKIRHFMLYEFHHGRNPEIAVSNINRIAKDHEKIDLKTCQLWFRRYRFGQSINDEIIPHIPWKNQPFTEIFIDIFKFMDRIEIEKCQLLCRYFNDIIQGGAGILPILSINSMNIHTNPQQHERVYVASLDQTWCGDRNADLDRLTGLRSAVIQDMNLSFLVNEENDHLLKVVYEKVGAPFKVMELTVRMLSDVMSEWIEKFLSIYFNPVKVTLWFRSGGNAHLHLHNHAQIHEQRPRMLDVLKDCAGLQLPASTEKAILVFGRSYEVEVTENEFRHLLQDLPEYNRLVLNLDRPAAFTHINDLVFAYIDIFQESEHVNKLFRGIHICKLHGGNDDTQLETFIRQLRMRRVLLTPEMPEPTSEQRQNPLFKVETKWTGKIRREKLRMNFVVQKFSDNLHGRPNYGTICDILIDIE